MKKEEFVALSEWDKIKELMLLQPADEKQVKSIMFLINVFSANSLGLIQKQEYDKVLDSYMKFTE